MKCSRCGRKVPNDFSFCPKCGNAMNSGNSDYADPFGDYGAGDSGYTESGYSGDSGYGYGSDAGYGDDYGMNQPPVSPKKKSKAPVVVIVAAVAVVGAVALMLLLSLIGLFGGSDRNGPVNPGTIQTRPDGRGEDDNDDNGGGENDGAMIVDCITCGGSGDCVACKGAGHCPYCGGTGVELCYSCWGTNKCGNCNDGVTTEGEKCKSCNGKGTCTWDECTDGYEPCWKCNGQEPCYLCRGDTKCLTCGGTGSYDVNCYPERTLTAYRAVEHDCWYGKIVCDGSWCKEGKCDYEDCGGTGKLKCLSCKGTNECQTCTGNDRYATRTCRSCNDTGECSLCDGGYDTCYMCEGTGNCGTCHGVYEKDCYYCLDGYQYDDYGYVIGRGTPGPVDSDPTASTRTNPGGDCTKCGGDGWWCNTCDGDGYCPKVECVFGDITCPDCGGAQSCNSCWYNTDSSKRCTACGGTGDCSGCDGKGSLKCGFCGGDGVCPTCDGDYWCDACGGTGFTGW